MKTILLPTDFSDNATNAIHYAVEAHKNQDCKFYLMHSYALDLFFTNKELESDSELDQEMRSQYEKELEWMIIELRRSYNNSKHKFESVVKSNSLYGAIVEVVAEKAIDLIVMGTQGSSGLREIFMGSNTVSVLKRIRNCPILIIPADTVYKGFSQIVFPTDFRQAYYRSELLPLLDLIKYNDSKVDMIRIVGYVNLDDAQRKNKEQLSNFLGKDQVTTYVELPINVTVRKEIEQYAQQVEADLIAIIQYKHSFLEKLTQEPIIKKLAFHTDTPLLVLPELE
ncbi:universal stress protein [Spongiivirga sp. MCCC 1A20706]|uniref:universal stress protein n=1 Tax=Spongiivirga sp. MCCC 1A20706 TaxID=3160963 RepID=UPI003977DF7B